MTALFINKIIAFVVDAYKLQSDLDSLYLWAETWLVKFNSSKCQIMHITQTKLNKINYSYNLGGNPLTVKHLGITISSQNSNGSHMF